MSKQEVGNIIAQSHKEHTCKPKGHKKNSPPRVKVLLKVSKNFALLNICFKKKQLKVPYIYRVSR